MKKTIRELTDLYEKIKIDMIEMDVEDLIASNKYDIQYEGDFRRNYVWNNKKATKLVETVLIRGEIPPIIIASTNGKWEILDGKQRYESLHRFYNNKFLLKINGLEKMKGPKNKDYANISPNLKIIFNEYKIKVITYNLDSIPESDRGYIKRDLYIRYNEGTTALTRAEIARAKYVYDPLTLKLLDIFNKNKELYEQCKEVFLPYKTTLKKDDRDIKNLLLIAIREIIVTPYVPIIDFKSINLSISELEKYYKKFIPTDENSVLQKINEFTKIFNNKLYPIKNKLKNENNSLSNEILFFKTTYWMFSILYKYYEDDFYKFEIDKFYDYMVIENRAYEFFINNNIIRSEQILKRHKFIIEYLTNILKLDLSNYSKDIKDNRGKTTHKTTENINKNEVWNGAGSERQVDTSKGDFSIKKIIDHVKEGRFIIQPPYQRSALKSKIKASRIIESIMLGVKLPPIYVYVSSEDDGIPRYIVVDRTTTSIFNSQLHG